VAKLDIGFETAVTYGLEGTTINVPFARNSWGSYAGAFRITYHTNAVTAVDGSDYVGHAAGELVFEAGVNTQNITILIIDDSISDPWKAFTIEIDTVTCMEAEVTVNVDTSSHTIFIVDDEPITAEPSDGSNSNTSEECLNISDRWNEVGNMATGIFLYDFDSNRDEGTVCYISGWLQNNVGELNVLINTCFSGANPGFGLEEEAIYRQVFLKNHYARASRNALRGISSSSSSSSSGTSELVMSDWTELRDGDSLIKRVATTATPATKADTSRVYKSFADTSIAELKDLVYKYNLYHSSPRQVAGKDSPS